MSVNRWGRLPRGRCVAQGPRRPRGSLPAFSIYSPGPWEDDGSGGALPGIQRHRSRQRQALGTAAALSLQRLKLGPRGLEDELLLLAR